MKIEVSYQKTSDVRVLAHIQVVDSEDYPSCNIFSHSKDYPQNWSYRLHIGEWSYIELYADSAEEAEKKVMQEITALKKRLEEWRNLRIPEKSTIII